MWYSEKMETVQVLGSDIQDLGSNSSSSIPSCVTLVSHLGFLSFSLLIHKSHEAVVGMRYKVYKAHGVMPDTLSVLKRKRKKQIFLEGGCLWIEKFMPTYSDNEVA